MRRREKEGNIKLIRKEAQTVRKILESCEKENDTLFTAGCNSAVATQIKLASPQSRYIFYPIKWPKVLFL